MSGEQNYDNPVRTVLVGDDGQLHDVLVPPNLRRTLEGVYDRRISEKGSPLHQTFPERVQIYSDEELQGTLGIDPRESAENSLTDHSITGNEVMRAEAVQALCDAERAIHIGD